MSALVSLIARFVCLVSADVRPLSTQKPSNGQVPQGSGHATRRSKTVRVRACVCGLNERERLPPLSCHAFNSDAFVAPTAVRSPVQQQQARSSRSHVVSMAATAEKPAATAKAADVPGGVMTLSRYMLDQARLNTDYQVRWR